MSYYTVSTGIDEDGMFEETESHTFETDSETLGMVQTVVSMIENLDNGEYVKVTSTIF